MVDWKRRILPWLILPRFNFIFLAWINVSLGTAVAWYNGYFHLTHYILALLGGTLAHMSVNIINDYYDYLSGIDLSTRRTPFSGGSGVLPAGLVSPRGALYYALASLGMGGIIGVYFLVKVGWNLLPILIFGGFSIYFYNTFLVRLLIGEFVVGLNFGPLMILGSYFVQTGYYSLEAFITSLAPGILTLNLLLLNEFPDVEADKEAGRHHLVTYLSRARAVKLFVFILFVSYGCIVFGVMGGFMPPFTLISLSTIFLGIKVIRGALKSYYDTEMLIPVMGKNVIVVLSTQGLIALGYALARLTRGSF